MTWEWIIMETVLAIHDRQIAEHGGSAGVRDLGLLESALARPENLAAYKEPDVFTLAAAYAFGIVRNHPFMDGNKRTAYVVCMLFLRLHGVRITAPGREKVTTFERLGSGEAAEAALADWLRGAASQV